MVTLAKILLSVFLVYTLYCLFVFATQRRVLFPAAGIPGGARDESVASLEKLALDTSFGKIEAWFLPAAGERGAPAPVIVFAHGNGELIDFWPEAFRGFNLLGIGALLVEYPGYGRSEGLPSQASITETFLAAYDAVIERSDVDASRVVLMGRSLGGGAICTLAARRPSAALILMSTFTSVRPFARAFFAPGFLVRDPFDNLAVARSYPGPILVIHGENDRVIPYEHGVILSRAQARAKMIAFPAGHNDCPPDWNAFPGVVAAFLKENGLLKVPGR